jgi:predicted nucleic acid-binding protein
MTYVADTSAWTNHHKDPDVQRRWKQLVLDDQIGVCEPVLIELLRSARNMQEFLHIRDVLNAMRQASIADITWNRALEVNEQLARTGSHRGVSLADLLVAAAAEQLGATVLHYDKDFDLIGEVTDQPMEWIAPRGTL